MTQISRRSLFLFVTLAIGASSATLGVDSANQVMESTLEPFTFEATFESGSVGSWASYPPAQDTAYDPTIWVRPLARDTEAPNRAIYREITPLYPGDYEFGVRELINVSVDDSSVLTFRAYVDAINGTRGVKVRLAFDDGSDATTMVEFDQTRQWVDARVRLALFLGSAARKTLTAIAFMAVCPDADPRALHRLGIDDVSIPGMRPR